MGRHPQTIKVRFHTSRRAPGMLLARPVRDKWTRELQAVRKANGDPNHEEPDALLPFDGLGTYLTPHGIGQVEAGYTVTVLLSRWLAGSLYGYDCADTFGRA